jgi:serine/threonine-protein kinase RsbW
LAQSNPDEKHLMDGNSSSWTWTLERTICSDPKLGTQLIAEVVDYLCENDWSNKDTFGIHMALEEAVMNAIKHGNLRDEKKCVKVKVGVSADSFWAHVEDEGTGFNPDEVPDPTLDENIEKTSGRGVMLMRMYMDQVQYSEVGNAVEFTKTKSAK